MKFQHKTAAEIAAAGLWPAGEYDFEVKDASEETSAAGNEMIKLTVTVHNSIGESQTVWDYLIHTEKAAYKVRHFCEATGLLKEYEADELTAEMCLFRAGKCKVNIAKDKSGQYPDKNGISDYMKSGSSAPAASRAPAAAAVKRGDLDDEIPF